MQLKTELWLHAILIVSDHKNLIKPEFEGKVYTLIGEAMKTQDSRLEIAGGTENHVHILFEATPEISTDELLKKVNAHRQERIRIDLLQLGRNHHATKSIQDILFHKSFPVDIRHNAKIGREKLAVWAATKLV